MSRRPRGFTLIELLVVIVIIGILSAMVFGALSSAGQTAKIAKTKATIVKLNRIIMRQYESYLTRRLPDIDTLSISFPAGMTEAQRQAAARVNAIRDLMRLEMPDRWSDVLNGPLFLRTPYVAVAVYPTLTHRYRTLYNDALTAAGGDPAKEGNVYDNAAAECLYMIVMSDPENAEQFHSSEIGDIDNDGLPEFEDAWGHPIRFLRWPAGFVEYGNLNQPAGRVDGPPFPWSTPSDVQSGDRTQQPDPFDPRGVMFALNQPDYALFPLIYSAGPDGIFDINIGFERVGGTNVPYHYGLDASSSINPYSPDANTGPDSAGKTNRYVGQPLDAKAIDGSAFNDSLDHYDNIHNHRIETK